MLAGVDAETDGLACTTGCAVPPDRQLRSLRAGWLHDSRRQRLLHQRGDSRSRERPKPAARRSARCRRARRYSTRAPSPARRAPHGAVRFAGALAGETSRSGAYSRRQPGRHCPDQLRPRRDRPPARLPPGDIAPARAPPRPMWICDLALRLERGVGSWPISSARCTRVLRRRYRRTPRSDARRCAHRPGEAVARRGPRHYLPLTPPGAPGRAILATVENKALFGRIGYAF